MWLIHTCMIVSPVSLNKLNYSIDSLCYKDIILIYFPTTTEWHGRCRRRRCARSVIGWVHTYPDHSRNNNNNKPDPAAVWHLNSVYSDHIFLVNSHTHFPCLQCPSQKHRVRQIRSASQSQIAIPVDFTPTFLPWQFRTTTTPKTITEYPAAPRILRDCHHAIRDSCSFATESWPRIRFIAHNLTILRSFYLIKFKTNLIILLFAFENRSGRCFFTTSSDSPLERRRQWKIENERKMNWNGAMSIDSTAIYSAEVWCWLNFCCFPIAYILFYCPIVSSNSLKYKANLRWKWAPWGMMEIRPN